MVNTNGQNGELKARRTCFERAGWKFNVDDARRKFKLMVDKPSTKD